MSRPNWLLSFIKLTFPRNPKHGWVTRLPGLGRWIEKQFFDGDHLITLPRNTVVEVNRLLEEQEHVVLPTDLMDYFIDKMEYHVIMDFCICRRSMPCKDYPIELGCLFMGEAVKDINPEWGRMVSPEAAKAHIRRCDDAGLIHFLGKSKLDTQWLGIGPGEKLLTICNCCPCCCITRGLTYADSRLSNKLTKAPGVKVWIADDCVGCGKCSEDDVCFVNAIHLKGERAIIGNDCRGCGRCMSVCAKNAIKISIDRDKFMNESIDQISRVVDVPV